MADTHALDVDTLRTAAGEACAMLRGLAHGDRLLLLCQLSREELSVGEIETRLGIRQPSLAQPPGVLRREGLVACRRDGRRVYYGVADPRAVAILQVLCALYCGPASADPPSPMAAGTTPPEGQGVTRDN